jgi:phenylpropionate dioxygenase-like ring-hydroxylating dioxygenase large terminal subunit
MQYVFDYTSLETLNIENEKLFDNFFHFGAHKSELSKPNSFIRIEASKKDIILINDNRVIRAFENTCPHRGCRLIDKTEGNEPVICPYHGWQFCEGKTIIPSRKDFDASSINDISLNYYSIEFCGDFIFFSPSPSMTLREQLGIFWDDLESMSYSIHQKIDSNPQPFNANWKISVENAIESYHVAKIHSETLEPLSLDTSDIRYDMNNSFLVAPIGNTKIAKKLESIGNLFNYDYKNNNYFSLYIFPFSMISSTYGYSYAFQTFFPATPSITQFLSRTYSTKTNYPDFFKGIVDINRQIFIEDANICELTQNGSATRLDNRKYVYSINEARIIHFHQCYTKAIKC